MRRSGPGQEVAIEQLDALSTDDLDQLPVGAIQVDGEGRVVLYNEAESRLSGISAEEAIGRDYFQEVAPGSNLPAFRGRFLEGVRRGRLNETFSFVFGGMAQPTRVRVDMRGSREPNRYWITTRTIETIAPSRQRAAAAAAIEMVASRVRAEPVDPSICEREPIHIPGAVQPHAVMLACDPAGPGFTVQACSENIADAFDEPDATAVIGQSLGSLVPARLVEELLSASGSGALDDPARPLRRTVRLGPGAVPFALAAHLYSGRLILEFERIAERAEDFGAGTALGASDAVARLRRAATFSEAAAVCAREIRSLTGYERVLVYRFDEGWNGEAVAEDKAGDWPQSLLGLRFPASDIPAQARALYARSPSRIVMDRDAVTSPILADPQVGNKAVDLSFAQARALSPIHLEYQRNLGVNGSMSVSVMVDDALWGLVIGHHRKPHYVSPEARALAGLVTDAFALRVHELETVAVWRDQQATLAVQNKLLHQMAGSDDAISIISGGAEVTLLDLFDATGAAVLVDNRPIALGDTPSAEAINGLGSWLREYVAGDDALFASDRLSSDYSPASDFREIASGLLAAFVDRERRHLLMWFRPEVVSTVVWGGDPNKPVVADASSGTILPRRSFERWVEERRGCAAPWAPWQLGTAEALAAAVDDVALRQGRRIAELTAKQVELTRALEQKDVLAREIDHRVKNSLQIVASVMLMQGRAVTDPSAKAAFEDTYARVMSVARVHESLHQSADVENVDLGQTLRQLCDDLSAGMMDAKQRLEVSAETGLMVSSQAAVALSLIATELVTNALKYAYSPGEPGDVRVSVKGDIAGKVELLVCDAGKGLPPDWSDNSRQNSGSGLGMRLIEAMLQQIGGRMSIENERPGACFRVSM